MNKKLKFAFIALIALNAAACLWYICIARYDEAASTGVNAILVLCYYLLAKHYYTHTDYLRAQLMEATQRAEDAEKKYKELLDDTPTRDKKGRFAKR